MLLGHLQDGHGCFPLITLLNLIEDEDFQCTADWLGSLISIDIFRVFLLF